MLTMTVFVIFTGLPDYAEIAGKPNNSMEIA